MPPCPPLNTTSDMNASAISTSDAGVESIIMPRLYSLDLECPVPWPSQTNSVNQDYPFHGIEQESPNEFVMRRYLETLWLPELITPLSSLVLDLRRFVPSPKGVEALHTALKPLLLSVVATERKYRQELPLILKEGGGAGEIEESMMWYIWRREKYQPDGNGNKADEAWRKAWMAKMERREVQVQILLHLHRLSVPCPTQNNPPGSPSKKRRQEIQESLSPGADIGLPPKKRRKQRRDLLKPPREVFLTPSFEAAMASNRASISQSLIEDIDEDLRMEDQLEHFMDKLCIWQLLGPTVTPQSSHTVSHTTATDQRDWMQIFCEDVVEPLFRERLPNMCDLLRTKVFPHSPFSDDSDHSMSPAPPATRVETKGEHPHSSVGFQELEKPQRGTRTRSRSLSAPIEEVRARGASRGGVATSKAVWRGKVGMKRASSRRRKVFKLGR